MNAKIYNMGQCPAQSPFWVVFQVFKNFFLKASIKLHVMDKYRTSSSLLSSLCASESELEMRTLLPDAVCSVHTQTCAEYLVLWQGYSKEESSWLVEDAMMFDADQ